MSDNELPTVAVVYAFGASGPMPVVEAARGLCRILWVCDSSDEHTKAVLPLIRRTADVVDAAGLHPERAAAVLSDRGVTAITTFSESRIRWTAAVASAVGWAYHSPDTAHAVTDKDLQRNAFARAGVPSPLHHPISAPHDLAATATAADRVGFPAVLKPRSGMGSRDTVPVDDLDALRAELAATGEPETVLEERLIGDHSVAGPEWGDYVSVETLSSPRGHRVLAVCGKLPLAPPYRETGTVYPSTLTMGTLSTVKELTTRALDALGVRHGMSHTEFKLTAQGPRLIEVNGRLGGGIAHTVRMADGPGLLRAALCGALGLPYVGDRAGPRGVGYMYLPPAPREGGTVRALRGVREIRKLAGVDEIVPTVRPGTRLDWRTGTLSHLAIVFGAAPDHAAVLDAVRSIEALLTLEVEKPVISATSSAEEKTRT